MHNTSFLCWHIQIKSATNLFKIDKKNLKQPKQQAILVPFGTDCIVQVCERVFEKVKSGKHELCYPAGFFFNSVLFSLYIKRAFCSLRFWVGANGKNIYFIPYAGSVREVLKYLTQRSMLEAGQLENLCEDLIRAWFTTPLGRFFAINFCSKYARKTTKHVHTLLGLFSPWQTGLCPSLTHYCQCEIAKSVHSICS